MVAEYNHSMRVTAGERGDGEVALRRKIMRGREKPRDGLMKTWKRQEMDLYSPLILRSVWLLEGKQMCLRAHGSLYSRTVIHRLSDEYGTSPVRHISRLISHRETVNPSLLHYSERQREEGEGWQRKGGPRDRMRNVMKVTEWQRENEREWQSEDNKSRRTGCLWWVCFLMLISPWFRGMLEIMWSSAWKRVSGIHTGHALWTVGQCSNLGCLSTLSFLQQTLDAPVSAANLWLHGNRANN